MIDYESYKQGRVQRVLMQSVLDNLMSPNPFASLLGAVREARATFLEEHTKLFGRRVAKRHLRRVSRALRQSAKRYRGRHTRWTEHGELWTD